MAAVSSLVLPRRLIVGSNFLLHAAFDSSEFLFHCLFSRCFLLSEAFLKRLPIHIKSEVLKGRLEALSTWALLPRVSLWGNQVERGRLYWTNLRSIGLFSWNFSRELSRLPNEGYKGCSCQRAGGWGWERPGWLPLSPTFSWASHTPWVRSFSGIPSPVDQTSGFLLGAGACNHRTSGSG